MDIPFEACLAELSKPQQLVDYKSIATGEKGPALKITRFASFPKYLMVQVQRFVLGADWRPKKVNARVQMPDALDLESLRSKGLQEGEVEMKAKPEPALAPDPGLVAQLMAMGFSENGCKRACVATKNANAEAALDWVMAHMEDANFHDPLPEASEEKQDGGGSSFPEETVIMLTSMGFTVPQVNKALKATGGNAERAVDWLCSRVGQLDDDEEPKPQSDSPGSSSSKYELVGFISHMGPNSQCGHYVCHIKKEGRWVIFNDQKVAVSKNPPLELGYLYMYCQK